MESRDAHALALKVMRLSRPSLVMASPITCEPQDVPGDALDKLMADSPKFTQELQHFGLSQLLELPNSLGNTYLGETFTSFISVHNESKETVKDVVVKAEVQTGQQRATLNKETESVATLAPDAVIEDVVSHEVRDLGVHILVCSVHYTMASGERRTFRKFFKFQVSKPLEVKTKFHNVRDSILLEAYIQNLMPQPMHLQSVKLEPGKEFQLVDLNNTHETDSQGRQQATFGKQTYLGSEDARLYLYKLVPKTPGGDMASRSATAVGKLDIVWRTSMGEVGHLQTSQLPRKPPVYDEAHLEVLHIPHRVVYGVPFEVKCKILNFGTQPLVVRLGIDESQPCGVALNGLHDILLSALKPQGELETSLSFVPLELGLQSINGVYLINVGNGVRFNVTHFPQVFVEPPSAAHLS